MANADQCRKCVSLAGMIAFPLQESRYKLRGVGNETLGMLEDRGNSVDGILANIGMSVLKAGACGGEEGLNELSFTKLAQES